MCYLPVASGVCTKDQLRDGLSSIVTVLCKFICAPDVIEDVYICKSCDNKKNNNKVPCHSVARLLVEWSPRELWQLETENNVLYARTIFLLECYRRYVSDMTKRCFLKILNLKQNADFNLEELQKNHFKHLNLHWNLQSWLTGSIGTKYCIGTF